MAAIAGNASAVSPPIPPQLGEACVALVEIKVPPARGGTPSEYRYAHARRWIETAAQQEYRQLAGSDPPTHLATICHLCDLAVRRAVARWRAEKGNAST